MGHGAMSADKLRKVVHIARHRDLAAFDPIAEAFKVRPTSHVSLLRPIYISLLLPLVFGIERSPQ